MVDFFYSSTLLNTSIAHNANTTTSETATKPVSHTTVATPTTTITV